MANISYMTSDTCDDLPERLERALAAGTGEWCRAAELAPELTYGRHRGPPPITARAAAVAILLFPQNHRWYFPLTVRPDTLPHHKGQISLPGGLEESGETSEQAALRELKEELGPQPALKVIGNLPRCYVFASDFVVTPWIVVAQSHPVWQPNPAEVQRVIEMPLSTLVDPVSVSDTMIRRGALEFRAPCYRLEGDKIWGATSVMLREFADLLTTALT